MGDSKITQDYVCQKHNIKGEAVTLNIGGKPMIIRRCSECEKEEDEAQREALRRRRQAEIDAIISNSALSPRFKEKTLDNYIVKTDAQHKVMETARWFVKNWRTSAGLLLLGGTGTGKNHISAGIAKEIAAQGATIFCTEVIKYIRAIKESWKDKNESSIIKWYSKPDLLIIDELGVQFGSGTEQMYLTELINDRYNACKPTILCGNLSLQEVSAVIGERALDRMRDGGRVCIFNWKSYRGNNAGNQ